MRACRSRWHGGCPVGLIINFNVALLKDGFRRMVRPDLYKGRRRLRDEEQAGDAPNLEGEKRRGEFQDGPRGEF